MLKANAGYLQVYGANRDVMRAFIEAANVDERFRRFWWHMRARHVERFLGAWEHAGGTLAPDARLMTEALAAMVEQSAYIWFAHGAADERTVDVDEAARVVTRIWHHAFFPPEPRPDSRPFEAGQLD